MPARSMAACLIVNAWQFHRRYESVLPADDRRAAEQSLIDAATRLACVEAGMNPYAPASRIPMNRKEE